MPNVKIQQWRTPLALSKGTILDAALRQGVPYPHSCRSGECGSCKTLLLCGDVEHGPCLEDALSDAERDQGLILACRAKPKTDVEIAWIDDLEPMPSFPVRWLKTRVVELELATHNVTKLSLWVRGKPLAFAAGQYARLSIDKLPARSFSMASQPDAPILEFHVRHVPGGLVSGYVASSLKVGDTLRFEGPFGTSYLREQHPGPIVAAAGGTGLAPVLSIVRKALACTPRRPIHVYFGVQDEADIYAESELEQLALANPQVHAHVVLSAPSGPTARRTGFVHQALEQDFSVLSGAKVYAAGPPPMVKAVTATAISRGVDPADIHSDSFVSSATTEPRPGLLQGIANLFTARTTPNRDDVASFSRPHTP
jgi:CDP-4-dehydro-6-deoxyglucose reductase/ferredoxin-NAD(P)+ reductase (naphthalene dioxygenase ferredoxin-specific)